MPLTSHLQFKALASQSRRHVLATCQPTPNFSLLGSDEKNGGEKSDGLEFCKAFTVRSMLTQNG